MTPSCTESGCSEAGRWLVGERNYCSTHGIAASTRGSVAMRLVCPIVEDPPSVWDTLQADLEAVPFDEPSEREQLLRDIAWAAIENGREGSR